MTYVIAEPCVNTKDTACVEVCPVDCIHPKKDEPEFEAETKLYIDPETCIDCGACVPVCPVQAIFPAEEVPEKWAALHADGSRLVRQEEVAALPGEPAGRAGAAAALSAGRGAAPSIRTETGTPRSVAGAKRQRATASSSAPSSSAPADSRIADVDHVARLAHPHLDDGVPSRPRSRAASG